MIGVYFIFIKNYDIIIIVSYERVIKMCDWTEQQLTLWQDFACELKEFIEYEIGLPPLFERRYREICRKYEEGDEED